jgi:hypothetical protein
MWGFASPVFARIFSVECKNRVKFGPAADLGDPAVRTVLAWSACMPSQSQPVEGSQALGAAPRGHGVASGDGASAPIGAATLGSPPW